MIILRKNVSFGFRPGRKHKNSHHDLSARGGKQMKESSLLILLSPQK